MAEDTENEQSGLRKLVLPAAVSIAGAGAGLVLSNKSKVKDSVPELKGGVGDLMTDLRSKLDSVLGKGNSSNGSSDGESARESTGSSGSSGSSESTYTADEFAARRRDRQERRTSRRAKS